ncbi:hypothetical protein WA1_34210 [Scytonema hofmannii PCC 7110]|uniref:Uncharacterized protein n=1 Tax=Scytonema hofmannii PCC 7110 TaxID=128403 RepID=A0A139X348_9CYAN|nr:DUF2007 domain-containing protein [Scytonema hofmannii]KYC39042.1 hypothetical protein WA1_34210 [Scytonema hofmannii PCC 7110]
MTWITLLTTSSRWQAELMQELLAAHNIPTKIIDLGVKSYLGAGTPAALQVRLQDKWAVLLLLSPYEDEQET